MGGREGIGEHYVHVQQPLAVPPNHLRRRGCVRGGGTHIAALPCAPCVRPLAADVDVVVQGGEGTAAVAPSSSQIGVRAGAHMGVALHSVRFKGWWFEFEEGASKRCWAQTDCPCSRRTFAVLLSSKRSRSLTPPITGSGCSSL